MLLTQNTRSFTLTRNFLRNFAGLRVASEDDYVPRITLLIGLFVVLVWAVHVLYSYTAAFAGRRMKGKTFYMILNRPRPSPVDLLVTSAVLFWLLATGVFWNIAGR